MSVRRTPRSGAASAVPTGWPEGLPPPESEDFEPAAVAWLLDHAPPEFRAHSVLRRHPLALVIVVQHYTTGALAASRQAYAGVRRELGELVSAQTIAEVLTALEHEGVRLARLDRELGLVADALEGRRWVPRL
jgi:hypothetical protein